MGVFFFWKLDNGGRDGGGFCMGDGMIWERRGEKGERNGIERKGDEKRVEEKRKSTQLSKTLPPKTRSSVDFVWVICETPPFP